MTDTATTAAAIDPQAVLEETNGAGVPIAYACEYHTGSNPLTELPATQKTANVEQFFDLVFPCPQDNAPDGKTAAADYVAEQLLISAATTWNLLPDGTGCLVPQNAYGSWLFGVATVKHAFLSDFGCQSETVSTARGECCQVVSLTMQFWPTGDFNVANLEEFVRAQLASDSFLTPSLPLRTTPIDPVFVEPGGGAGGGVDFVVTRPPDDTGGAAGVAATAGEQAAKEPNSGGKITVPGGFLLAALVCAVIGVGAILWRRYRRAQAVSVHNSKGGGGDDGTLEHGGPPSGDDEPFRVSVLSDADEDDILNNLDQRHDDDDYRNNPRLHSPIRHPHHHPHMIDNNNNTNNSTAASSFDVDDDEDDDDQLDGAPPPKYAFDLSSQQSFNVMGKYGFHGSPAGATPPPTTMQVVAPYPILDNNNSETQSCASSTNQSIGTTTDASEADSWAQTDATVGSLEERLEEITAEI